MKSDEKRRSINLEHPEYFFWGALILALALLIRGGETIPPRDSRADAGAPITVRESPFAALTLEARAAFVYDHKAKRTLFKKNADEVLPLASITKLMTAATALSLIPETTLIAIDARALAEEGDTGLRAGETWILRDLLQKMLVESSNDAAYAVSSQAGAIAFGTEDLTVGRMFFITRMNERAKRLGLTNTLFKNESGLDLSETEPGAMSTAKGAAYLLSSVLSSFPSIFSATRWEELTLERENGETRWAKNTNNDTGKFPLLIISKTGYTDLAGGNLVIAFDAGFNHPIIISVLGSSREGRFEDAEKLVWATLKSL